MPHKHYRALCACNEKDATLWPMTHHDVMTWKRFLFRWPFVRRILTLTKKNNADLWFFPLLLVWTCCSINSRFTVIWCKAVKLLFRSWLRTSGQPAITWNFDDRYESNTCYFGEMNLKCGNTDRFLQKRRNSTPHTLSSLGVHFLVTPHHSLVYLFNYSVQSHARHRKPPWSATQGLYIDIYHKLQQCFISWKCLILHLTLLLDQELIYAYSTTQQSQYLYWPVSSSTETSNNYKMLSEGFATPTCI